jgi:hypothetical protein
MTRKRSRRASNRFGTRSWLGSSPRLYGAGTCARRGSPAQETLGAQVLIDSRPTDPITSAAYFPPLPLLCRGGEETWIPGEGHNDAAPVHQLHGQAFIVDMNAPHANVRCGLSERIHATPPISQNATAVPDESPPPVGSAKTPSFAQSRPDRAKLLLKLPLCPRGREEARLARGCRSRIDNLWFGVPSARCGSFRPERLLRRLLLHRGGTPAQYRLARRRGLVEPAARGQARRGVERRRLARPRLD